MRTTTIPSSAASNGPWQRLGEALVKDWWLVALRGLLSLIFGIVALVIPVATILALVLLFSAVMLVDGCFALYAAVRAMRRRESWGMLLLQSITSIAAGVIALLWPGITVVAFVLLLAAWSIVSGCLLITAAYSVDASYGRGWLTVGGVLSLLFGTLLIVAPVIGAVVLTWWLGAYALLFGVALLVLAFRLRSRRDRDPSIGSARSAT